MDFSLTEDQTMLARTAADFVNKTSPLSRARKLREDALGFSPATYREMADLGWLSIPFPEDVGGLGCGFVELSLVLEQLGKTLVPEPLVPSVLAGVAIDRGGDEAQRKAYLAPLIEGKTVLSVAHAERSTRFAACAPKLSAKPAGDGYTLDGEKVWVLNGNAADHFVVTANVDGEPALFIVDKEQKGLTITALDTFDGRKAAHLQFASATLPAGRRLSKMNGAELIELVMDYGAACAIAEGTGLTQTVLDMTVEYLKTREQFDVKIGSFQALQHRAVDMFIEAQLIRSVSYESMVKIDDTDAAERKRAISAAKVQLSVGGKYITRQSIQLHGGVGCTDEHDIGLYFKRMQVLNTLFGDEEAHIERYAALA